MAPCVQEGFGCHHRHTDHQTTIPFVLGPSFQTTSMISFTALFVKKSDPFHFPHLVCQGRPMKHEVQRDAQTHADQTRDNAHTGPSPSGEAYSGWLHSHEVAILALPTQHKTLRSTDTACRPNEVGRVFSRLIALCVSTWTFQQFVSQTISLVERSQ